MITRELIVDSFAGGGGASTGIEMALGRSPDIAINHDDVALAMHAANHPATRHLPHNIWKVDPAQACGGALVGLLWTSPDCKHFSKAKGGRPVEQGIRDLAWVVVRWARQVKPRVIILENVEEFATWGPLGADGRPCPQRSGQTFQRWIAELRGFGYQVEHRELCAADYGAPTVRKRLFLIARRDGLPIVWPAPTHAKAPGRLKRWRAAAEIIDWSLPCPSIFDTSAEIMARYGVRAIRPLAANTLARIARGVQRYVLDAAEPFIVPITHTGDARVHGLAEPLRTVTTAHRGEHALISPLFAGVGSRAAQSAERSAEAPFPTITATKRGQHALIAPLVVKNYHGDRPDYGMTEPAKTVLTGQHHMLVAPMLINTRNGEREGQDPRCRDIAEPHPTATAKGSQGALVAAFLAQHNGGMVGHAAHEPVSTVTQRGTQQAVVSAGMINMRGTAPDQFAPGAIDAPVNTISAGGIHAAEVRAFLTKFHGDGGQHQDCAEPLHTADTRARFGLVTDPRVMTEEELLRGLEPLLAHNKTPSEQGGASA